MFRTKQQSVCLDGCSLFFNNYIVTIEIWGCLMICLFKGNAREMRNLPIDIVEVLLVLTIRALDFKQRLDANWYNVHSLFIICPRAF